MAEPVIHVYAQEIWHDDAYIAVNREGLLALKKAIETALEIGSCEICAFTADGEGFSLEVLLVEGDLRKGEWVNIAMPYTDELASEKRPDALWPAVLAEMSKTR
ncbi:hypothetical protein SDD30_15145 [Moorella naiadis]|uniref:hypothetical protein n=1 Tax=Moorella naiadis (nom. illeg.) TaxID=3093670 RepID=UPI003D9CA5C3